jgi:hypothetical protein
MPFDKKTIMQEGEKAKNQKIEKKESLRTFKERSSGF